jgi:hypothetical protein
VYLHWPHLWEVEGSVFALANPMSHRAELTKKILVIAADGGLLLYGGSE